MSDPSNDLAGCCTELNWMFDNLPEAKRFSLDMLDTQVPSKPQIVGNGWFHETSIPIIHKVDNIDI